MGFEQGTTFALQDLSVQTGISSAVSTFYLLKEGQPNHPAKLSVTGFYSKLPGQGSNKVATTASVHE